MAVKFELEEMGRIASVEQLVSGITTVKSRLGGMQMWYRGHSNAEFELKPSSGRKCQYADRWFEGFDPEIEQRLLDRFRRRAYAMTEGVLNEWEIMFIARHHGLPTRILDWTSSPLVALYFAVSEQFDAPATLWAFARVRDHETDLPIAMLVRSDAPEASPFKYYTAPEPAENDHVETQDAVKLIHPLYNSPRITAQNGVFTFHSNPRKDLGHYANVAFHRKRLDLQVLFRWDIEGASKPGFIRSLEELGVNARTVYPDLDGLAKSLWQSQVLWRGKSA
jgi:hypothetical protein